MKRLIFVRHGKSSWDFPVGDKDRPLKKRAYKDAEHVITAFKAHLDFHLEIFSSPAKRARTTAELFKTKLNIEDQYFHISPELYTFDAEVVLEFIKNTENNFDSLMLFGHNPAYTELVNRLGSLRLDNLPTTGLVSIVFQSESWSQIQTGDTRLYLAPKHLR
ncbi:SixA phosphatase family protein [Psychroflexus sediminis]|uniref:Phosphohistidine phosphatase n=1 Tax=Psychroflexus sediminis TaxID=470826 RepID=A0A1G7V8I3_9FLAO|nr:histidine phosphatase family protein [Psychroflexus sediminis]SDG55270.1 phosphohistidine phosphatase [Psychroflexus sediminis]